MHGKPVGILEQDPNGKMSFRYQESFPSNMQQISHSLPLSMNDRVFSEDECKPFFEGLLPESDSAREALAKRYGISSRNTFSLLQAIGKECAGAISFHDVTDLIIAHESERVDVDFKTDVEIEALIKKLPTNPLLNGIDDIRLSLAGVQDKMCIYMDHGDRVGIPKSGSFSTHILKPEIDGFSNSAYNEYFCLSLAKALNLTTVEVKFRKIGEIPCIIVERYDRLFDMKGYKRLHQEDFCQALRKLPTQKYQNEGGPSLEDCFKLLDSLSPYLALDRIRLAEYVLFNFLVGNTDAHGKNFSILYGFNTLPRLAPLYDVLCCQIYENHSQKMAMKIGSKYLAEDVFGRHWEEFCKSTGLSFPQFKKEAREMCKRISLFMEGIVSAAEKKAELKRQYNLFEKNDLDLHLSYVPFARQLQDVIQKNIDTFLKRLE